MNDKIMESLPFYSHLNNTEKEVIRKNSINKTVHKNQLLMGEDACSGLVYVTKGSLRVFTTSLEGREMTLFHIKAGEYCILSSWCVINEIGIDAQLIGEEETELITIFSAAYKQLMDTNIYVRLFSYELSTERLSSVTKIFQHVLFTPFDVRLAIFLLEQNTTVLTMTQQEIAVEVNSAREVVSRTLHDFEKKNWIEIKRGKIIIKDIDSIQQLIDESE